jgi:transcriptional regulator PpsR
LKHSLATLDGKAASSLLTAVSDITLLLDKTGRILDVSVGNPELSTLDTRSWLGKPWVDTVTVESRDKIALLLKERAAKNARWRQVNHPVGTGQADFPVLYRTGNVGTQGLIVAMGRDLRAAAALQQKLLEAQQALEDDYARLRQVDTRYRLLFQTTAEAVVVADATSGVVTEANPAAAQLLGHAGKKVIGLALGELMSGPGSKTLQGLLDTVRATGRGEEVRVTLGRGTARREFAVSGSLFRQENVAHVLLRLAPSDLRPVLEKTTPPAQQLTQLMDRFPDGFVVTDPAGQIVAANNAFLDAAELGTFEQARGKSLDRWLGRSPVDVRVLLSNLQQHGVVRHFSSVLSGEFGASMDVEVSAVSALNAETPSLAFMLRDMRRVAGRDGARTPHLAAPVEQLTELIGRVSLKELVRESTDMIERLCIEAALELTGDNRASAAEMLGLSRQSLYIKLRRHGLGDLESGNEA